MDVSNTVPSVQSKEHAKLTWQVTRYPPTNRRIEIPFTAVVNIRGDRLYHEHIS